MPGPYSPQRTALRERPHVPTGQAGPRCTDGIRRTCPTPRLPGPAHPKAGALGIVGVKAAAGLLAEVALGDEAIEPGAGLEYLRLGVLGVPPVHDGLGRVEPDEISERKRPHRMAGAQLQGGVCIFQCCIASFNQPYRLENTGDQEAVHYEPGSVFALHRCFANIFSIIQESVEGFITGGRTSNNLQKFHHWDRVEEMQASKPICSIYSSTYILDLNRRCVGRKNCVRWSCFIDACKDLVLDRQILCRSFDN
mmetsp:Transcript_15059/g.32127  ORF Transcript_15059/g.32127 Transcript_15059/m.32127 type:complete len:252 (+) Transcript_15059:275-1030(+)